jgi:SAM-dependent methyltransferase
MDLWALTDLATPWCVFAVVTLRVAGHIAAGKSEIGEIAEAAGADRGYLLRVLRHLAEQGVFEETAPGRFALNDTARALMEPPAMLGFDLDGIGGRMAHAWSTLLSAVRTGRPAYHEVFGKPFWEDLHAHPAVSDSFDALMGPGHGTPDAEVLIDAADWDKVRTVVDVGGGTGSLLAEVLRRHPEVRGILVDLPRPAGNSREVFERAGVLDRVAVSAQSFFDPLPSGADVYLLKSVLGDWPDAEARTILRRCAEAARPAGRVVLLNGVTPNEKASPDLLMVVLTGGKERTLPEFRQLAGEAGLEVRASARQASRRFLVECVPVTSVLR